MFGLQILEKKNPILTLVEFDIQKRLDLEGFLKIVNLEHFYNDGEIKISCVQDMKNFLMDNQLLKLSVMDDLSAEDFDEEMRDYSSKVKHEKQNQRNGW
jgi:hypothetical protein